MGGLGHAVQRPPDQLDERPPAVELAALGDLGGAIGASLLVKRAARV